MRRPNIILMKVDMTEHTNQEKSFIVGGFASHRWRGPERSQDSAESTGQTPRAARKRVQIVDETGVAMDLAGLTG